MDKDGCGVVDDDVEGSFGTAFYLILIKNSNRFASPACAVRFFKRKAEIED